MLSHRFDALLIDFYGTICAGDREAVESCCGRIVRECGLDVKPGEFAIRWGERFFATIEQSNHEAFATLYECEMSSLRSMLLEFGVDRDPEGFVADLEAYWRDPPIYGDAVEFLARVDIPVCCVSNADTVPLLTAIEKHNLRFDAVISSEMARCYKPDPQIFQRAFDAIGVAPSGAVHIGDSMHSDIGGAGNAGIQSVWLHRESRIHDIGNGDKCKPEFTVTALTEVLGLF